MFNKAYEDKNIHLLTQELNLSATADDLHDYDWNGQISIASYFAGITSYTPCLCIIDTPGVDAALYKEHSKRTHDALLNDDYDTIICVVSPTRLGTDAEQGTVPTADDVSVTKLVQSKKVEDGKKWVKNTDKKWYKPWTWLQAKGRLEPKYKTVKYVPASDLAQEFFAPIKESAVTNGELAKKHAIKQSKRIVASFNNEFERLDDVLKQKLSELESYATDETQAEERIKETEKRLAWLEEIKNRVASILEI